MLIIYCSQEAVFSLQVYVWSSFLYLETLVWYYINLHRIGDDTATRSLDGAGVAIGERQYASVLSHPEFH